MGCDHRGEKSRRKVPNVVTDSGAKYASAVGQARFGKTNFGSALPAISADGLGETFLNRNTSWAQLLRMCIVGRSASRFGCRRTIEVIG
jgi:hypothetical protein